MAHLTRGPVLMRVTLIPAALILFVLVSGFLARVGWATGLWPWPAKPLSFVFIASILAAIAVPVLWIALAGEAAAIRAGALDLTVMYGGMFIYVLTLTGHPHEPRLWPYALAFGLAAAGSAGVFLAARQVPWADPRPMPRPVRLSFAAFALILIGAGVALLLHASIFPWQLGPETSVMFGWTFLGAATYFIYGTADPRWSNAVGQLAGFLAYDVVLLAPFSARFSTAHGGSLVSLIIYVAFLVYSGTLASYYLFASDATRIRLASAGPQPPPVPDLGDADPRRTPRGPQHHHLPIPPIRLSHPILRLGRRRPAAGRSRREPFGAMRPLAW